MLLLFSFTDSDDYQLKLPTGFESPEIPEDNILTEKRVALGEMLFFENILSKDSTLSCGSCHFPEFAFSDTTRFSTGFDGQKTTRNAPTILNTAYHPVLMRDGGVPSLEMQVLVPLQEATEMNLDILDAAKRLEEHPMYSKLAEEAYPSKPDVLCDHACDCRIRAHIDKRNFTR